MEKKTNSYTPLVSVISVNYNRGIEVALGKYLFFWNIKILNNKCIFQNPPI